MQENDNNSLAETLVNYEMLIEMIPELGEVVYTGMVTLDAAKAVFQELSEVNQIDFVESLDCVKRMLQQRDSRIKEMENDIAAKTVVETPADYIPLQKANRDMERQNEFLEARIRKLDKENGQLKRQLADLQRKQDPEQERLKKIHETVQLFSGKTEIYLKEMDKDAWLLDELQNIPGVGAGKAKRYGEEFCKLIKRHCEENEIERPEDLRVRTVANKSKMKVAIIQAIDRKVALDDIAMSKGIEFEELLDEIEAIVYSGTKLNIDYFLEDIMDEDHLLDIYDYFKESTTDNIDDALDELGDDFTEEEVRLVRIKFISEMAN